jgi:hypothetical protein
VAVAVGVVAGTLIGFGVDAVLSRVQRRPRARRLGADPEPAAEREVDVVRGDVRDADVHHADVRDSDQREDLREDLPGDHELLPDDVLREGVLPGGDLPEDLLEDDRPSAGVRHADPDAVAERGGRREPAPAALLPGEHA